MRTENLIRAWVVLVLLFGWVYPVSAQSSKEFALMSAVVAEGANIWLPSTVIVKAGDSVKLTVRNTAPVEHGFSIEELGVKEQIPPGETKELTIKAATAGVFRYFCHLHKGHVGGQLLVQ